LSEELVVVFRPKEVCVRLHQVSGVSCVWKSGTGCSAVMIGLGLVGIQYDGRRLWNCATELPDGSTYL
jgi:hypothetical protein